MYLQMRFKIGYILEEEGECEPYFVLKQFKEETFESNCNIEAQENNSTE